MYYKEKTEKKLHITNKKAYLTMYAHLSLGLLFFAALL